MKELNGRELVGYIKEGQARRVRQLKAKHITPKLAILYDSDNPVIAKYMELKQRYGDDLGIEVEKIRLDKLNATDLMKREADDPFVHGMIVQLPLEKLDMSVLDLIPLEKDVDGLRGENDTATAMAIHWLLNGYNIELPGKKIAIVGHGKLVGAPLERMWKASGYDVTVYDKGSDLNELVNYDIVVSATGVPGLIKSNMLKQDAIMVDAGTASEGGILKGDLDETVREERDDLIVTPRVGGVGPLTVAMLFEQVLRACEKKYN